jgi:hypothetical protein
VISCFLLKSLMRLYERICPPEESGKGRYGVSISIFIALEIENAYRILGKNITAVFHF